MTLLCNSVAWDGISQSRMKMATLYGLHRRLRLATKLLFVCWRQVSLTHRLMPFQVILFPRLRVIGRRFQCRFDLSFEGTNKTFALLV